MTRRLAVLACAVLAGCAATPQLVLLPGEQGGRGAVAVLENGTEVVVDRVNSRTRLGQRSHPVTRDIDPRKLTPQERALLGSLPAPPVSFTLYFTEGTTLLTPESKPTLASLKAEVAVRPGVEVQVTGHTDTVGNDTDNDILSRRRAVEIVAVLTMEGIDPSLMSAVGRGKRELREQTADGVADPVNRRVEVIVR